jgi:hypothetical protein
MILTLCLLALGTLSTHVWQVARQPGTTIWLLPPQEWFSHGVVGNGVDRVTVAEVWGCMEITSTYPR